MSDVSPGRTETAPLDVAVVLHFADGSERGPVSIHTAVREVYATIDVAEFESKKSAATGKRVCIIIGTPGGQGDPTDPAMLAAIAELLDTMAHRFHSRAIAAVERAKGN